MAAAVAAPIPRLAPVTTASRPASHLAGETAGVPPGSRCITSPTSHSPVEALVCVQAQFQVKLAHGVLAAGHPRNTGRLRHRAGGGLDIIGRHQETGYAIHDHLTQPAAPERHHGSPDACASAAASPKGSSQREGHTTTAARAMAAHNEVRGTPA